MPFSTTTHACTSKVQPFGPNAREWKTTGEDVPTDPDPVEQPFGPKAEEWKTGDDVNFGPPAILWKVVDTYGLFGCSDEDLSYAIISAVQENDIFTAQFTPEFTILVKVVKRSPEPCLYYDIAARLRQGLEIMRGKFEVQISRTCTISVERL